MGDFDSVGDEWNMWLHVEKLVLHFFTVTRAERAMSVLLSSHSAVFFAFSVTKRSTKTHMSWGVVPGMTLVRLS